MSLSGGTTGENNPPNKLNVTMVEILTSEWQEMRLTVQTGAAITGGVAGSLALLAKGAGHLFLDNFVLATSNLTTAAI